MKPMRGAGLAAVCASAVPAGIIESSSGTLGLGLALAGMVYQHPVTVVTDPGLEPIVARMLSAYGVQVEQVNEPHPQGGWQQARRDRVAQLLAEDPEAWNPDQYNNPDNVSAYRELALEMAPLVADKDIDFGLDTQDCHVLAHPWMLREATRNLLHNAIRHSPPGARLQITLRAEEGQAALTVSDQGPGISDAQRERLFQPFWTGDVPGSSGLGLTICHEIVHALGGRIALLNRQDGDRVVGLDACVRLPLV